MPSPPIMATASSASRSSSDPGNVITPTRGVATVTAASCLLGLEDAVVLDHRVRQEATSDLIDLCASFDMARGLDLEPNVLADVNCRDVGPPEGRERRHHGL